METRSFNDTFLATVRSQESKRILIKPSERTEMPRLYSHVQAPSTRTLWKTVRKTLPSSEDPAEEEGIIVAIRIRPLNSKETHGVASTTANRVWRVLPQLNSITQTTQEGQPLPERVIGKTFFTYDKTFGEDTTTGEVYGSVAKGIVDGVMAGLNGTIFVHGQTSSGKTYTMQGSGSVEEGYKNGGGGVIHMAAKDIFAHIHRTPERIFLVRASFIEIYNEEVRDLLNSNTGLQIREDPKRGVFVKANEKLVTDFESLLAALFTGEKIRAVAPTCTNERSSRSHAIFRITIESRHKNNDEQPEGPKNGNAVRVSTLNLVDLAGSESMRHTGATGERQKEGGKINQSLLTLSRVIAGLGQPNQSHINFRDSKLTRILQTSLLGNARLAVICCVTPSGLYLEETRSTLLFASRAKLLKTRAQVNEVLDERSVIKRLQRELEQSAYKNEELQKMIDAMKVELCLAKNENEILRRQLLAVKEDVHNLKGRVSTLILEKDAMMSERDALASEMHGLKMGFETLRATNLEAMDEVQVLRGQVSSMTNEKETLRTDFRRLKEMLWKVREKEKLLAARKATDRLGEGLWQVKLMRAEKEDTATQVRLTREIKGATQK